MTKNNSTLNLLPYSFKRIVLFIMLSPLILVILSMLELITFEKELLKTIVTTTVLLGLLLFALTKDKIEDELTMIIRLKALAISFIYGVMMVIVEPFSNLLFDHDFSFGMETRELLLSMLLFYFIMKYLMKRGR